MEEIAGEGLGALLATLEPAQASVHDRLGRSERGARQEARDDARQQVPGLRLAHRTALRSDRAVDAHSSPPVGRLKSRSTPSRQPLEGDAGQTGRDVSSPTTAASGVPGSTSQ